MFKREWTWGEILMLKNGILPPNRTYHATQQFCSRMKIKFCGKQHHKKNGIPANLGEILNKVKNQIL